MGVELSGYSDINAWVLNYQGRHQCMGVELSGYSDINARVLNYQGIVTSMHGC